MVKVNPSEAVGCRLRHACALQVSLPFPHSEVVAAKVAWAWHPETGITLV